MFDDEFMMHMGYRQMLVNDKIEECLEAKRCGADSITIDTSELSDLEEAYIQNEVQRRIENGDY